MVVKALQWLLCTYLVLKFLQYFFVGRSGFRATEPSFRDKLVRGEPLLFIVACAISVPTALWTSWYFQRGYEGGLARAADCYGKLSALNELDDVAHEFDALRVYRQVKAAAGATAMVARELERAPGYADEVLAAKKSFYTQRYSGLSRRGDRGEIQAEAGAVKSCMTEPLISF